jgi:hypothetical protein
MFVLSFDMINALKLKRIYVENKDCESFTYVNPMVFILPEPCLKNIS